MRRKIVFSVLIAIFLLGLGYSIWFLVRRDDKAKTAILWERDLERSAKFFPLPPGATPRLDELNKLVWEQLKKEAAEEAEAKKITKKERRS